MKVNHGFIWGFLFMLITGHSHAQNSGSSVGTEEPKRPSYLHLAMGFNASSFRDFATSPLVYSGTPIYLSVGHVDVDQRRESSLRLSYRFGNYQNAFNGHEASSQVKIISLNYGELFELKTLSSPSFHLKIGGQWSTTVNFRENGLLQNNSSGLEAVSNLFGTAKGTFKVHEVKALSAQVNLGLVNSNYRNGFVYSSQSAPTNQDRFFDQYRFRVFSGYRFNTQIDYTVQLKNMNALRFSYEWDAYSTGSNRDEFEMASHVLRAALLFNLR